ncbi:MAG TPA: glycosyltransferase family 4 protein [Thermodesulfobacteriota bacterium]|nr:glycosyltransferase family 4 protein [Thermodesulfobacteriota bacterium]
MAINIHLIRTHYPHWGQYSGINQFLKYINQNSYHVDLHLSNDNDEDFPIRNRFVQRCLRYFVRRGMQQYKLSDLTAEIKAFRKCFQNKVDIVHYLDGEHSAHYLPWLFKKWNKFTTKILATFHQPPDLLDSLIIKDVVAKLDFVTVLSPDQVAYFGELLAPDKICLIPHGVDTNFFKPRIKPKEESKFKCITVGHWLRNFKAMREVANKLVSHKNIEFHVVASRLHGPRLIGLEDLKNVTIYRDNIDDTRLLELYQESDVLFLPLLQSAANNALLEGVACGLPVISTLLPSVKFYLPGKEAILIKDSDTKKFVDAILYLVDNSQDRIDMGREARKRAEDLDWRNITPQYENLYSKLIT